MRCGESSEDWRQSLKYKVISQHCLHGDLLYFSILPSGMPCDMGHFMFFKEVVACLFFWLGTREHMQGSPSAHEIRRNQLQDDQLKVEVYAGQQPACMKERPNSRRWQSKSDRLRWATASMHE
eukprot:1138909-Pelagomonas_calceolata.AAC.2